MSDVKEKDLPKMNDAAYIRALDANGNPILISKADLAQVAAELIWDILAPKDNFTGDFDNLTANGVYRFSGGCTNIPGGAQAGGLAIVVNWQGEVPVQIITNDVNKWYIRMKWYHLSWRAWAQLN